MGYNNGIISQPVGIHDVQQCLGTSDNDLATLCMKPNINMWSFRKPIYSTKMGILTEDDWKGGAHILSGFKTGGGILKAVVTGTNYLNSIIQNSGGNVPSAVWEHDKPILNGECFFRLTDFNGYRHTASRSFSIVKIYGNVSSIIIPSSGSTEEKGTNYQFSLKCEFKDGSVSASQLFTDCYALSGSIKNYFYPGVILTCSSNDKLHYVMTADQPISAYMNSNVDTVIDITINSKDFLDQVISDWRQSHSGNPYEVFPFRTNDNWTACLVLISRNFTGGSGSAHKLNGSETIVRLEYADPTDNVYVDRKTLPLKQSKYNNIEWMKATVTIKKNVSDRTGYDCYKIESIVVKAKMLTTDAVSFNVNAEISANQGIVIVPGYTGSGSSSVQANGYIGPITFSGTVGEVQKSFVRGSTQGNSVPETTFYIQQSAAVGNHNCNIKLTFVHSTVGSFISQFSFDVSGQRPEYSKENVLL